MAIILNGTEIQNTNGATFIEKVTNYFIGQGGVANSPFGTVVLDKKGAKNSKNHGIGSAKAAAFAAVKDVLEQGSIQVPMEQYGTNPNKEYLTGMVAANIQISGIGYTCVVEVCKNKEGLIRLYNHEVTPINTKPQNAVATSRVSSSETTPRLHQGAMAKVARKYQDNNKEIKESKSNKRIETWYRGFNREYGIYGEETPHLLWLTTDLNYAKEYGDSIMEYKIDMSKCHGSIEGMGYLFDFDMSEGPDEEYASYLLNEYGVNSYCYYGGLTESSYCMCLWDETPIVSQRILDNTELNESKNMKKNVIKLNESALRKIVAESVKKVLNEQNPLLKNGYEVLNLVRAYQDDDSEEYIAMLQNMSEACKKQVEEITGTSVDEMLSHWYAFHQAMIAIKKRYSELLTTDNNDGGYYDWR